ncbi:MAG: alpha/beta hydrolase [Oscillospiraceae bacterium]
MGYNAFALIYRPDDPYTDLAQAIAFIQNHAEELEVDPEQYSLWGGSAGARMAAELGNIDTLHSFDASLTQAGAVIMQYTGYTKTSQSDAPTYVCVGKNDGIASWKTMQNRLNTLESYGIPTEFHAYEGLPHGFGLGTDTIADGWIYDAVSFWENQMKDNNLPERRQVGNLQNYLHGKTNHAHGNDYDFNNDNIWNVIDLALLKRKLLSNNPKVNN